MSPSRLLRGAAAFVFAASVIVAGSAAAANAAPVASSASHVHRACANPKRGQMACLAEVVVRTASAQRVAAAAPSASTTAIEGYRPSDITSAYGLSGGTGGTVAIVDAYDNPKLESDLAVYRKQWGLPACTTANGCFTKVNQRGSRTALPEQDADWGLEEALDVDAVSAACPTCRILVVEGDDPSTDNLGTAVNYAVKVGAKAVSNSYGGPEATGVQAVGKKYYTHPGVAILASSGDNGFPAASSPATFTSVVAVGGTTLTKTKSGRGWAESAWSEGGSGCSAYIAKPAWQPASHCPMRASADLSAVADPDTGLAIYDTFGTSDYTDNGWIEVGGTSLSSPLVSAMLVRSGTAASYGTAQRAYQRSSLFHDVTTGSNGVCGGDTLCTAKKGWDAPTGVGTPAGLSAF